MDTIREVKVQNKLTNEQQKFLEEIERIDGYVTIIELSRLLNKKYTTVYTMITRIEKKGYNIRGKIKDSKQEKKTQEQHEKQKRKELKKKKLKKREKELLDIFEENEYNISFAQIARKLGISRSFVTQIVDRLEEKGYSIRQKLEQEKQTRKQELTEEEKTLLCVEEENNYEASLKMVSEKIKIYPYIIPDLIKKFTKSALETDDTIRVSKFIKNKRKLSVLERQLRMNKKICYGNMSILIAELLQDEEECEKVDKKEEIDFIIKYAEILLDKNIEQVQNPLNQLLKEHEVQLTKAQALSIENIMSKYKTKVEERRNDIEVETEKKTGEPKIDVNAQRKIKETKSNQEGLEL